MSKLYVLFVVILLTSCFNAQRIKVKADRKESFIQYNMSHPAHDWSGISYNVTAVILTDENKDSIYQAAVTVPVSSFDSKNSNRDSHAMEVTEAEKYPKIKFVSKAIDQTEGKAMITGVVTFHGKDQKVMVEAESMKENGKLIVKGKFRTTITEFDIEPPSLMTIATEDFIELEFYLVF